MKNRKFLIFLVIFLSGLLNLAVKAQILSEHSATPELLSETAAKLLISEINFKNKSYDFVELYYESPTGRSLNLKGLRFQDDKVFKQLDQDFVVKSGSYILLTFNSGNTDNYAGRELYTKYSGLTGTTEQLILIDASQKVVDAVCWSSKTPTDSEKTDQQNLFEAEGWISADPSSCIASEDVATNQSVVRFNLTGDTDGKGDWLITNDISPKVPNVLVSPPVLLPVLVTTQIVQSVPVSVVPTNVIPQPVVSPSSSLNVPAIPAAPVKEDESSVSVKTSSPKSSQPASSSQSKKVTSRTNTTPSKTSKKLYQNGDLSENIVINEILAHAKTDDRHNEWVELYNKGESDVDLGNWQLDDGDGGSKPYIIPDSVKIKAQDFIVIKAGDSKLSLANQKDEVRLFDYEGNLLQTVSYENAPVDQSFSRVVVYKVDGVSIEQWFWDKISTPGQANPDYQEFSGLIVSDADFNKDYSFLFEDGNGDKGNSQKTIHFDENFIPGPLAKATFVKGAKVKLLVSKFDGDDVGSADYLLRNYEILTDPVSAPNDLFWFLVSILSIVFVAVVFVLLFFFKKLPWQKLPVA